MKNSAEQTESNEDHTEQEPEIKHIGTPFPICAKCGAELEMSTLMLNILFEQKELYLMCRCGAKNFISVTHRFSTQIDEQSMNELFDIPKTTETCKTCKHRERWECGSMTIQYCNAIKSNRTFNKLKKIKCKNLACSLYEKESK